MLAAVPEGRSADPLIELAGYDGQAPDPTQLRPALARGRSIGSGAVEGTIKQEVNLRLKRTGARWRVEHVGPLVELRALSHTPEWSAPGPLHRRPELSCTPCWEAGMPPLVSGQREVRVVARPV